MGQRISWNNYAFRGLAELISKIFGWCLLRSELHQLSTLVLSRLLESLTLRWCFVFVLTLYLREKRKRSPLSSFCHLVCYDLFPGDKKNQRVELLKEERHPQF